jgi:multiple sugar transport system permease protein
MSGAVKLRFKELMTGKRRALIYGLLFVSPWLIGFLWLTIYPMLSSLYYAFTDYNLLKAPIWVGMANFKDMLKDDLFRISTYNTFWFTIIGLPLCTIISLVLALLLNQKIRGQSWYRTFFYIPSVVPMVAASMCWIWFLNPVYGPFNQFLHLIGINAPNWVKDIIWAKPAILLTIIWVIGPSIVIYLAALQDVPTQLLESAELDGAGRLGKIFNVVLPVISPSIFFNVVNGIIGMFQLFTQPFIITASGVNANSPGGPANATLVYTIYLYQNAFRYFKMGYASALAWILFIIIFIFTVITSVLAGRWVYYESGGTNR